MGVGEERKICFEEDGIITLKSGALINVEGDKVKVVSSDRKEVVHFDKEGKFIKKIPNTIENNLNSDFGCLKYFEKMGKRERKVVKHWLEFQEAKNEVEEAFLYLVTKATKEIQYGYHISTIEASFDGKQVYFKENAESRINLRKEQWEEIAKEFAPQYKSKAATLLEVYYWYAYKVASGDWTREDVEQALENYIIVLRGV